jgi:hypothetical protein
MSDLRDPDRIIAAYFAQPAPDLPDRAFDTIRRDIHGIRQRRVFWPWRQPERRALGRALSLAAAVLVIVSLWMLTVPGLGPGGGPPSSPTPTPNVFRSPFYGYSLVVPTGWSATPATARWDGVSAPSLGPNVDQVAGPHLIVLGYAGPFGGTLTAFVQDRIAANARDHSDTCPSNALQLNQPTTVGGEPAVLLGLNCGARIDQVITVHDGVGYAFTIRDAAFSPTLDPTDFAIAGSMLDSLTFPVAPIGSP